VKFTVEAFSRRVVERLEDPRSVAGDADGAFAEKVVTRRSGGTGAPTPGSAPSPRSMPAVVQLYARLHRGLHEEQIRVSGADLVFLVAAYDVFLGREPEQSGFLAHCRHLACGGTRAKVLFTIIRSHEYVTRCGTRAFVPHRALSTLRRMPEAVRGHWLLYAQGMVPVARDAPTFPEWRFDRIDAEMAELAARQFELAALVREKLRSLFPNPPTVGAGRRP
jgi:hypothetical protein